MRYVIRGIDATTGQLAALTVRAASLPDAAEFAAARGVRVETAENEQGRVARLEPTGEWRYLDKSAAAVPDDAAVRNLGRLASLIVPVIGLALFVVYVARRQTEEAACVLILSLVGGVVWFVFLTSLSLATF